MLRDFCKESWLSAAFRRIFVSGPRKLRPSQRIVRIDLGRLRIAVRALSSSIRSTIEEVVTQQYLVVASLLGMARLRSGGGPERKATF